MQLLNAGFSLDGIAARVERSPATVSYWLAKHGLQAVGHAKYGPRQRPGRDELSGLVESGLTLRVIAERHGVAVSTVRRWLEHYELETVGMERRRVARVAREAGAEILRRECARHGPSDHALDRRGTFRCLRCRWEAVVARRRRVKQTLVEEAGGSCRICGYRSFVGALEFHHLDPSAKEFGLSHRGLTVSLERARAEATKCVLLCSNCHAEVEAGVTSLPHS